jgi:predicted DCC family thiol-disulfide oxidoreductase YuxK
VRSQASGHRLTIHVARRHTTSTPQFSRGRRRRAPAADLGVTLVFDGCCGFCTRTVRWLLRLDRHERVHAVPSQLPGTPQRLGLTPAECAAAAWVVDADGTRHRGAGAVNAALAAALGTSLPVRLYRVGPIGRLQDRAYAWVARNRHQLPGITPWCEAHAGMDVREWARRRRP